MIRRLFWALLGLGAGVMVGARVVRQVDRVTEAAKPGAVAERTGRRVGGFQARLGHALAAGRDHARQRERELRAAYAVPTLEEIARSGADARTDLAARPGVDEG